MINKNILWLCALFSSASFAELQVLDFESMESHAAQAGISLEVYANTGIDLYYVQDGNNGGALKIEGARAVKADPVTGVLTSEAAPLKADIDVVDAPGDAGAISISSTYQESDNAVFKIDAIRLGSVDNATGDAAFQNAYSNINGASPALSLGKLNISGLTGTAKITIRAQ